MVARIRAEADAFSNTPEGNALRKKAEDALKKGGMADFIGIMLGADGY